MMEMIHLNYPIDKSVISKLPEKQVMAIGQFDGVHLGHQEVIGRALSMASEKKIPSAVMTFYPHPKEVLGQQIYTDVITPLDHKMDCLEKLGIDYAYVLHFDEFLMKLSAETFVEEVLIPLNAADLVIGFDFTFGYKGLGTADKLMEWSNGRYGVEVVSPFTQHGIKTSSTEIRSALKDGDVMHANELLGRYYSIRGKVIGGDRRGRTIGFPTANMDIKEPYVTPAIGVYAVYTWVKGKRYKGVMSIGTKPTFSSDKRITLEVHILDFHETIYGEDIQAHFVCFLRPEKKFSSVEALVAQIQQDVKAAETKLA
jgi:riboflavin kinase / FMN adenylyltransferase